MGAQRFGRPELPNANPDGFDRFGAAIAVGDFDGDGADDLAVGAPFSDGPGAVNLCGQVVVRYGVPGRALDEATAPTVLGQFVVGSTNPAEAGDLYGAALAACDFNGDGFDDLAVGVPFEALTVSAIDVAEAGVVEVYYGSANGLVLPAGTRRREPGPAPLNLPTAGAHFGSAVACGDFDGNGFDDLAVGLPDRDLSESKVDAGRVLVFAGSGSGVGSSALVLDQDTAGMDDTAEAGDHFGATLAAGDFDGNGIVDLVIGVPQEGVPLFPLIAVGAFHVLFGSEKGLGAAGDQFLHASFAVTATVSFATVLAVGNFDADPYDDLVVGSPLGPAGGDSAGEIFVYSGSPTGLSGPESFSADSIVGEGASAEDEEFGTAVAAGDFDGDGADDLAVGIPLEDVFGTDNGALVVVRGAAGPGLAPSPTTARQIHHGLEGFPGDENESSTRWGTVLAAGDFDGDGHADLVVGAHLEFENLLSEVGTVSVLYGALFADGFEDGGVQFWSTAVPAL